MKILQIIPSISLVYGGPSQMVLGLSESLAQQGQDVTIITTNTNGDQGQLPLDVPLETPLQQKGYQIIYFPCFPFKRYKFSLPLLKWLSRHGKNYDIAHIHALFSPLSTFSAKVCYQQKLPYILRPLGTLDPKDLAKKKILKYIYGYTFEKNNLKNSALLHFTSAREAEISVTFGEKINKAIMPLGVNIEPNLTNNDFIYDKFALPRDKILILFMSRIEPKKGLNLLIPCLNKLALSNQEFHFILAGSNPQDQDYEEKIKAEIKQSPLEKCTTITGFVRGENKQALLEIADLFVLPSYYENFGIAVVEASARRLPVVISDQVYISDTIQEYNAGWVCKLTEDDLSQQLTLALASEAERKQRGENGFNLVQEEYTWVAGAEKIIKIYQQIITE